MLPENVNFRLAPSVPQILSCNIITRKTNAIIQNTGVPSHHLIGFEMLFQSLFSVYVVSPCGITSLYNPFTILRVIFGARALCDKSGIGQGRNSNFKSLLLSIAFCAPAIICVSLAVLVQIHHGSQNNYLFKAEIPGTFALSILHMNNTTSDF
jgi:hypothetical protein